MYAASDLVKRTLELVGIVNADDIAFTNGFSDDPSPNAGEYPIRILPAINEYVLSLAKYKYNCTTLTVNLTAGTATYTLPSLTHEVMSIYFNGSALTQTTRNAQDTNDVNWSLLSGVPTSFIKEGLDIALVPAPNGAAVAIASAIKVRVYGPEPKLVVEADTFSKFPASCEARIPYGATIIIMGTDAANPAHARRLALYAGIASDMEADLKAISDKDALDFETQISADNYEPAVGGRQIARGRPTTPTRPAGAGG